MQTVGIDMSAEPKGTAIATLDWFEDRAVISSVQVGASDDIVLHYLHHPDGAIGVDCPLGWPTPFVEFVLRHEARQFTGPVDRPAGWRRPYVMRSTDLFVQHVGMPTLSIVADKIGHVAIRLAALMCEVDSGVNTARDGSGAIMEVYPAAALRIWGLPWRGYKGKANSRYLNTLVDELKRAAPWLVLDHAETLCRTNDDALDAVVCALIARAAKTGHTISAGDRALALHEGWIHLPDAMLPSAPWTHEPIGQAIRKTPPVLH
jgi:hypothetical protein